MSSSPFDRFGPAIPVSPVVLSVPHAGRDYPPALLAALIAPGDALRLLEDRHVDAVALAATNTETMLVQRRARAWIDLNRGEDERDPAVDEGADRAIPPSAKVCAGLGLVPRRVGRCSELWRRRWTEAEVASRIAADHRPFHAALGEALAAARRRFGTAVLVDLHSMPPLSGRHAARIVIGDRHGASADPAVTMVAEREAARSGLRVARNQPYAGGHVVERHGRPIIGVHAIQVEIDRSLYLDRALDAPATEGVARTASVVRAMIDALARSVLCEGARPHTAAIAAE